MNIEDLGNIGEFIGSLGVIFSLIYLGFLSDGLDVYEALDVVQSL